MFTFIEPVELSVVWIVFPVLKAPAGMSGKVGDFIDSV